MSNIKRIVFDLDNTLIPWKNEYVQGFAKAIKEFEIPFDIAKESEMYASYEQKYDKYKIDYMIEHFKKEYNIEVSPEFINAWLTYLGEQAEINQEINETLKELKKNYDLVVLTNFFARCQEERLKTAGMLKYFTKVIGGDKYVKPNPLSFKEAIGDLKPSECLMVGDNLDIDIKGALNVGMNVCLINKKASPKDYSYPVIKSLPELKRILKKKEEIKE